MVQRIQEQKQQFQGILPVLDHLSCARIGTAGYTAALCVEALVANGVKPEDGKIIVSGATGGVGSVAVAMLSNMGYSVSDLNITPLFH